MKILIADDHQVVRKGLRLIIEEEFPEAELYETGDAFGTIQKVKEDDWSLIILDVSMPGKSGIEILGELKKIAPFTPVLILSAHEPDLYAVKAIKGGASGYLTKDCNPDELIKAVQVLLTGKHFITPDIAELLAEIYEEDLDKELHDNLSFREFEVFKLLVAGKTTSEIATILLLNLNTVCTYRARILQKMHKHNTSELIKYAVEHNLTD
jgi:DNA-binding NarL/FixJ family response regulator